MNLVFSRNPKQLHTSYCEGNKHCPTTQNQNTKHSPVPATVNKHSHKPKPAHLGILGISKKKRKILFLWKLETLEYHTCNNKKNSNIEDKRVRQPIKIQYELFILLADCVTDHFNSLAAVMMGKFHEKSVIQN